jgi:hypothetical protein
LGEPLLVKTLIFIAASVAAVALLRPLRLPAILPENVAAGLGLADQALLLCGLDQQAAARVVTALRATLNPELAGSGGV